MPACPNCLMDHRSKDICMVQAALGVVEDRLARKLTAKERNSIYKNLDVDEWWDDYLGPAIDAIEELMP